MKSLKNTILAIQLIVDNSSRGRRQNQRTMKILILIVSFIIRLTSNYFPLVLFKIFQKIFKGTLN